MQAHIAQQCEVEQRETAVTKTPFTYPLQEIGVGKHQPREVPAQLLRLNPLQENGVGKLLSKIDEELAVVLIPFRKTGWEN